MQIENIPDLTPVEKVALQSKQIVTAEGPKEIVSTEELWRAMSDNSALIGSLGLADADKRRVLQALAKVAAKESNELTKNWFAMHVADLIVAVIILSSLAYIVWVDQIRGFIKHSELFVIGPRYVVATPNGLAPFHSINKSDVSMTDGSIPATLDVLTGRYANVAIPRGAVIDQAKLSSGLRLSSFDGFAIFQVRLPQGRS